MIAENYDGERAYIGDVKFDVYDFNGSKYLVRADQILMTFEGELVKSVDPLEVYRVVKERIPEAKILRVGDNDLLDLVKLLEEQYSEEEN